MENNEELNDFGYDCFVGREVFDDHELFVDLDFHGGSSGSCESLTYLCTFLVQNVQDGKKVLLSKSPGNEGPIDRGGYTLAARSYEPLEPLEMRKLRKMYEAREETRELPNPFDSQPKE